MAGNPAAGYLAKSVSGTTLIFWQIFNEFVENQDLYMEKDDF